MLKLYVNLAKICRFHCINGKILQNITVKFVTCQCSLPIKILGEHIQVIPVVNASSLKQLAQKVMNSVGNIIVNIV